MIRYTSAREERVLKGSRGAGARWTLKTIQKSKERRTTVNSNESETPEGLKRPEGFKRKEIRGIKHKSLILAQDERWRRA